MQVLYRWKFVHGPLNVIPSYILTMVQSYLREEARTPPVEAVVVALKWG